MFKVKAPEGLWLVRASSWLTEDAFCLWELLWLKGHESPLGLFPKGTNWIQFGLHAHEWITSQVPGCNYHHAEDSDSTHETWGTWTIRPKKEQEFLFPRQGLPAVTQADVEPIILVPQLSVLKTQPCATRPGLQSDFNPVSLFLPNMYLLDDNQGVFLMVGLQNPQLPVKNGKCSLSPMGLAKCQLSWVFDLYREIYSPPPLKRTYLHTKFRSCVVLNCSMAIFYIFRQI